MTVTVDNMIRQAADNGWDFFEQLLGGPEGRASSLSPEQLARAQQLSADAASVYATESGRRLIDHLVEITLNRATFTAMLGLPVDRAYGHGVFREGQNAIVFTLLKMIAEGRKETAPTERTST